jgi:plasmid stabilization system protein ParE
VTDSLPVRLHPRAEDDASAAYGWYLERNPIVAEIFFVELNSAMDRIAQNPRRWPRMGSLYRRYVLGRFPYSVVYQERPRHIEAVAVAHHRRRPGYWARR